MEKQCGECKEIKSVDQFHRRKSGHQSICKSCRKAKDREWYQTNPVKRLGNKEWEKSLRQQLKDYKSSRGCLLCPETEEVALDFHHVNPDKEMNIMADYRKHSKAKLFEEVAKCVVLCSNCHRKVHAGILEVKHGSDA